MDWLGDQGYGGAGTKEIIRSMNIIKSQSTSNPSSSISQIPALEALNKSQDYVKTNTGSFQKKRDLALSLINKIPKLDFYKSERDFYLFSKCSWLFGKRTPKGDVINSINDLATYLLKNANIAIFPGVAFGLDGYFRILYITSETLLMDAYNRISKLVVLIV